MVCLGMPRTIQPMPEGWKRKILSPQPYILPCDCSVLPCCPVFFSWPGPNWNEYHWLSLRTGGPSKGHVQGTLMHILTGLTQLLLGYLPLTPLRCWNHHKLLRFFYYFPLLHVWFSPLMPPRKIPQSNACLHVWIQPSCNYYPKLFHFISYIPGFFSYSSLKHGFQSFTSGSSPLKVLPFPGT